VDPVTGLKHDGDGWVLEVSPAVCNPWGAIYGGAAVAACVTLAAEETGAPVRWVTTRFLAAPQMGDLLAMTLSSDAVGGRTSQVSVRAGVGGNVAFESVMVVGVGDRRPEAVGGQWVQMPAVPAPEDCEPISYGDAPSTWAFNRTERRVALGPHPHVSRQHGPGRVATWIRFADLEAGIDSGSPPALAWLADCVAMGFGQAIGPLLRATSLDNTVRFAAAAPTDWVLVDAHATGAADGYAYGEVHLFSRDGVLLATGSQSMLMKARAAGEADLPFRP
jgi:acyl-CoA thioesterase